MLAELDRLEATLAGVEGDVRQQVRDRLTALLGTWDEDRGEDVADRISAASDDEMFEFIGKELGIS